MSTAVKRTTVTLLKEKSNKLEAEAKAKGLSLPTYCRVVLSDVADSLPSKAKN